MFPNANSSIDPNPLLTREVWMTGTYLQVSNAISPYTNPMSTPPQFFRLQAIQ